MVNVGLQALPRHGKAACVRAYDPEARSPRTAKRPRRNTEITGPPLGGPAQSSYWRVEAFNRQLPGFDHLREVPGSRQDQKIQYFGTTASTNCVECCTA